MSALFENLWKDIFPKYSPICRQYWGTEYLVHTYINFCNKFSKKQGEIFQPAQHFNIILAEPIIQQFSCSLPKLFNI